MYRGASSDDPQERFIAQFDWDGAEAIYRARGTGPAYRVTIDEYHSFLDDYDRRNRRLSWLLLAGWLLVGGVLLFVPPFSKVFSGGAAATLPLYVLWVPAWATGWFARRWLTILPARALRSRTPEAPGLAGDERLSRTIGERSWQSLFGESIIFCLLGLALALLFSFGVFQHGIDLISGLLLVAGAGILAWDLIQMARKWRFERRQRVAA